jgi:multidrug efflux system membrane fusion protein
MKIQILLAASLLLAAGCGVKKSVSKPDVAVPVLAAKAVGKNVPVQIDPPPGGHVLPISSVTIRPQVGGILRTVNFQEGQAVKKGDLLFTIDPRPMQSALDAAAAALARDTAQMANAKIDFEREQKLFEQKLISQSDLDTSKSAFDALAGTVLVDQAAITNAQLNLEFTEIRAPIDGVAGGLQFHEGNVVKAPDDVLVTVNQIHPIYAAFGVPERYLPEIQRQMRLHPLAVTASFENLVGEPPPGELTFVDNAVDTTTGMIQLKATFPNTRSVLWPGQFVQLSLQLDELTNAVVVPTQAVQPGQSGPILFVVKADQTVEARNVKTSITVKGETVIASGLQAGETVVTDGQLRLLPGVKVSVSKPNGSEPADSMRQ